MPNDSFSTSRSSWRRRLPKMRQSSRSFPWCCTSITTNIQFKSWSVNKASPICVRRVRRNARDWSLTNAFTRCTKIDWMITLVRTTHPTWSQTGAVLTHVIARDRIDASRSLTGTPTEQSRYGEGSEENGPNRADEMIFLVWSRFVEISVNILAFRQ